MARITPPAGLRRHLDSIDSPPAPQVGGPASASPPSYQPPIIPALARTPTKGVSIPNPTVMRIEKILDSFFCVFWALLFLFVVFNLMYILSGRAAEDLRAGRMAPDDPSPPTAPAPRPSAPKAIRHYDGGVPPPAQERPGMRRSIAKHSHAGSKTPQPSTSTLDTIVGQVIEVKQRVELVPPPARRAMDAGLPPVLRPALLQQSRTPRCSRPVVRSTRLRPTRGHLWVLGILATFVVVGAALHRRHARAAGGRRSHPHLGAASIVGNTRESNQDRVRIASIAGVDVIVLADGLGGLPHGGEAAEAASTYAMGRLRKELKAAASASLEGVRTLLLSIAWATALRLAQDAQTRGWTETDSGFRTTLILIVALRDAYVITWVGDGGVFVVHAGGTILPLLEPHKSPATPDLLEASLGPVSEGRPAWAMVARAPGDLLMAATDGVADIFDDAMAARMREHLTDCDGDANRAAQAAVEDVAGRVDERGDFVVTDNLTIALLTETES